MTEFTGNHIVPPGHRLIDTHTFRYTDRQANRCARLLAVEQYVAKGKEENTEGAWVRE